ncbi:MAG: NAD(P)/FAD-dependent oxidoreductase [Chloroflexi bacterium]|nr:MAG: NAD(P)/FAD-dependent oxidoreductase [Chloroflexota bacterium]
MASKHVVILGAGPAGLTAAYELNRHGVPLTVLEKDPRFVGGLARTVERDGYRFDIGGHRFFSKSQEIEDLWTEMMGEQLRSCARISRIYYRQKYFDYPLKPVNALRNLGPIESMRCLLSYAWARMHPVKNPRSLEDWVRNQFGYRLFSIFFKTYTEKVWGISTSELSADWAAQRIKGLSLMETIRHAVVPARFQPHERGAVIKTLIDRFRYPRLGPGQLWEVVRDKLVAGGRRIELGAEVTSIRHSGGMIRSVAIQGASGRQVIEGTDFISTLPIRELIERCDPPLPTPVREAAAKLKYRDFLTVAVVVKRDSLFPDNWIYIHDPAVKVGRIQNFKNWSPDMVPDQRATCLGLEYFCFEGDGLWTSSDEELVDLGRRELATLGICRPEEVAWGATVRVQKAYPVYDDQYREHVAVVREYLERALPNLHLVGRNGMHHYNNQDHSMMTALLAARNIATGTTYDVWKVNSDAEYHEEARASDREIGGRHVPMRIDEAA